MGTVTKEWSVDSIAAQEAESTGWVTIPDGTTRIDVQVFATDAKNFKHEITYKVGAVEVVVLTNTNVTESAKRFESVNSWDGPFEAGAQFSLAGVNQHATAAVVEVRAKVTYNEPDAW